MMAETVVEDNYRIKWVRQDSGRRVPILLQNRNGPCPLLAISNALLLRGNIELHEDMTFVLDEQLIERITEYIFNANPQLKDGPEEVVANEQQVLADVYNTLPRLKTGIDVNVKFNSPEAFEFTPELSCFDMCRIRLFHGWLVDPEDKFASENFAKMSYNQLVDYIVSVNSADNENDMNDANADAKTTRRLISETAANFLEDNPSQLTYCGLQRLHDTVKENEICVFFRNNHFSTLTKRNGELFCLVSDLGFLNEPEIVWDKFIDIHGDSQFHNVHFQVYDPSRRSNKSDLELARELQGAISAAPAPTGASQTGGEDSADDPDYQLAKKLQEMELKRTNPAPAASRKAPARSAQSVSSSATTGASAGRTQQPVGKTKEKSSSFCTVQ